VTTHAIGHDVEAVLRHDGEVVFVVAALAAYVCLAGNLDAKGPRH
jgi:hypothetical protein